jgi:hypothetical protein
MQSCATKLVRLVSSLDDYAIITSRQEEKALQMNMTVITPKPEHKQLSYLDEHDSNNT